MKSLDRSSLDEQIRLTPRYVAGDLSRSERAEFEAWLVASPELAAEVEMERRLRRGLVSAARRGWISRPSSSERSLRPRHWSTAIAASAVITLGLAVTLVVRHQQPGAGSTGLSGAESRAAMPMVARLGRTRGFAERADVQLSLSAAPSQLVIEPDVVTLTCRDGAVELECSDGSSAQFPMYPEYEVDVVSRRSGTLAWRSARQQPVMASQLSFTLRDPSSLTAGDYDLVVRGVSPDHEEVVARYWLNVAP